MSKTFKVTLELPETVDITSRGHTLTLALPKLIESQIVYLVEYGARKSIQDNTSGAKSPEANVKGMEARAQQLYNGEMTHGGSRSYGGKTGLGGAVRKAVATIITVTLNHYKVVPGVRNELIHNLMSAMSEQGITDIQSDDATLVIAEKYSTYVQQKAAREYESPKARKEAAITYAKKFQEKVEIRLNPKDYDIEI